MTLRHQEVRERREVNLDADTREIERRTQMRLRDMDRLHTERLCDRYRHLVPPERVRQVKDMPVLFEDRHDFERSYREAGGANPPEGTQAVGFSLGTLEPAHVDMHDLQLEKTAIHERVHQLSDPRAREALGEKFYEGVTEDLAIKELGHQPNPELPRCYPRERAAAQELRRICGDDAVDRAYFAGDTRQLGVCLERRLGKDNLAEFRRTADATSRHGQDDRELGQCRT